MFTRIRSTLRPGIAVVWIVALVAAGAFPAVGADSGTIDATVTVAAADEACILVGATSLDFGTLDFGGSGFSTPYTVEKCTSASQELWIQGTDASLSGGSQWLLAGFPPGVDQYNVDVNSYDAATDTHAFLLDLALAAQVVHADMAATADYRNGLFMPAEGSGGAGEVASFQIIWTAVLSS